MNTRHAGFFLVLAIQVIAVTARAATRVDDLRCEFQRGPVVIDSAKPRLNWAIASDARGESQTAYQIQVTHEETIVWDSGRIRSDRSVNVEYAGEALKSAADYQWKVRVWDQSGTPTDWSQSSKWEMGLLDPRDWKAKWITVNSKIDAVNEPFLRRSFSLEADPQSAVANVNVMGWFELFVNGVKVSPDVISPAVTDYSKRSLYLTYDVKPYLRKGDNCIGLWMSRGWYWPGRRGVEHDHPIARLQLDMSVGGKPLMIGTDTSWRCKTSGRSILDNWTWSHFGGEQVDARLEEPAWCSPTFSASDWLPVAEISDPTVPTQLQRSPADRVIKTIPAVACNDLGNGFYALDFGTNLAGWLQLRLPHLRAGQVVDIQYSDSDKNVSRDNFEVFGQHDRFISAGKDGEIFTNKFNYHGFRYATIEGLSSPPDPASAQALAIGAPWESAGNFECSNALINRMHEVDVWTTHSLSQGGYMSDCPHRERLGYGGDGQVSIDSCIMNFWMPRFYEKWTADWRDVQDPVAGYIPHTAPQGEGGGGPPWGAGLQALAWRLNLYYDDRRSLEENYAACSRYVEMLESHEKDGLLRAFGPSEMDNLGDWVPPVPLKAKNGWNQPPDDEAEFFNNCYLVYLLDQLSQIAGTLGRIDEATQIAARTDILRARIHAAYFNPDRGCYINDNQINLIMPLLAGVTPKNLREAANKKLEDSILIRSNGHLSTGLTGTYFLIRYLSEIGRDDLLWKIVTQTSFPGWGYMLDQGATTWWEEWDGTSSRIHACFNSLDSWFYQDLAGIRPDAAGPGFKRIIIKPAVVGDLTWVKADHDSLYGRIVSNWERKEGRVSLHIVIPPNTTATIYVPAADVGSVEEGGAPASNANGLKFLRMETGAAIFHADSGSYDFSSRLAP